MTNFESSEYKSATFLAIYYFSLSFLSIFK